MPDEKIGALIERALEVAAEGSAVFPCRQNKQPAWSNKQLGVEPGSGGFKIATRDPEEIKRLFAHPQAALIGVATGAPSGIAVVDIDTKDGKQGLDWYDAHQADLGGTRWHRTRSGGLHLVYALNGVDPGTSAGVIHDGVDLRAGGGYAIWWPAHGCEFGDVEVAPFPGWLADACRSSARHYAEESDNALERQIITASDFHGPMISLSCRLAHQGYGQRAIVERLAELFNASAAASARHPRHRDWTRRKLDIHRTATSAVEKTGSLRELPAVEAHAPAQDVPRGELPSIADYPAARWDGVEPTQPEFVIEGLAPRRRLVNVAGIGGAGKGILLQLAATCIAAGLPFLGKGTAQGAVAYYCGEDEDAVLHHRQARINGLLGLSAAPGGLYVKSYIGFDLTMFNGVRWTALFDWLWNDIDKIEGCVAVVIDPASEVFAGDFVNPVAVKQFCRRLDIEAVHRNLTVFLLMHTAKGGDTAKTPFGSAQWLYATRATLMLEPDAGEDGRPSSDRATLRVGKANYVRPGEEIPLVWTDDGLLVQRDDPSAYQQMADAQELKTLILELCETAWQAGSPLSDQPQARDNYLPTRVRQAARGKFPARAIKAMTQDLMRIGRLAIRRTGNRCGLQVLEEHSK